MALAAWTPSSREREDAMQLRRREFLHLAAAAALAALPDVARAQGRHSQGYRSQAYPCRPVRVMVGFPPGGGVDVVARIIAQPLSSSFGRQFVVENRPGAGSNIATETVARATPDGYTLLLISVSAAINAALDRDLSFDLARDLAPVAGIMRVPGVMEVSPSFPARTVAEFIAYAKANPGKINMASAGNGTLQHLCGEMFKQMTGVQMVHVPYRGSPAALTALMAGEAQVTFDPLPSSIALIRSAKLRALAVTSATRADALPGIPAVGEYVAGFEATAWYGLAAPAKTPAEIIQELNVTTNAALGDAAMMQRLGELGGTVIPGPPSLFGELVANDIAKWRRVIKAAGITE